MKKKPILPITIAILGTLWVLAIITYTALAGLPWNCWGGIAGIVVAVFAAEVYLLIVRNDASEKAAERGLLPIILTCCYLPITVLMNSVLVLVKYGDFNWLVLFLNFGTLVGYIIGLMWLERSASTVATQITEAEEKIAPSVEISRKLGELLAITNDEEIRDRLLKLKESVDYSSNISTRASAPKESQMGVHLDELAQLIISDSDRLVVLNKLSAAEMVWKMRCSAVSSRS